MAGGRRLLQLHLPGPDALDRALLELTDVHGMFRGVDLFSRLAMSLKQNMDGTMRPPDSRTCLRSRGILFFPL